MKQILAAAVVLGAAAVACSGAEGYGEDISAEELGGICGEFKYELEATLAAQVGRELGRWESDRDFYVNTSNWSLQLTNEGKQQCANRGMPDCPGVSALLTLQFNGQGTFHKDHQPDQFRNILLAHHMRHMDWVKNNKMPISSVVDLNYESWTNGACGPVHWYRVDGVSDTSKIAYKLIGYGSTPWSSTHENPYLTFQSTQNQAGIDPTADYQDGVSSTSSGSCSTSSSKIDCSGSVAGSCCYVNGRTGTYQKSTFSNCIYQCK